MKTFNRASLPDSIEYKGKTLKYNSEAKSASGEKAMGKTVALVCVMSRRLSGKRDLGGNYYQPSTFIFTDK